MTANESTPMTAPTYELAEDFVIFTTSRRASGSGTWVVGRVDGHRFDALVFPEHAEIEGIELGKSRIGKLRLRRESDRKAVANFDRGWDLEPATPEAVAIVEFLAEGLADLVYPAV